MKKFGYLRAVCAVPPVKVGDCSYNADEIIAACEAALAKEAAVVLFPELSVTGYTCGDLFFQSTLLAGAAAAVRKIADWSVGKKLLVVVGSPVRAGGSLYNCAVALSDGEILGIVPKTYLPNSQEFYEKRWFHSALDLQADRTDFFGEVALMGADLIFALEGWPEAKIGIEICEDLWAPIPPSSALALAGATVILNPSASNEVIGKAAYRDALVAQQSARLNAAYLYCSSGFGESTTDLVFGGDAMIYEKGLLLARTASMVPEGKLAAADIDLEALVHDRCRQTSFGDGAQGIKIREIVFESADSTGLERFVDPHPFVPGDTDQCNDRCREILDIQTLALGTRITHIGGAAMVVGISGGLDSTLALLVCLRVCDRFGIDRSKIHAVTMPGFGTTDRTYDNAVSLIKAVGATFHEVGIGEAVRAHFADIGHDPEVKDVTYENAQARERTQILMDLSNEVGGIVIGTGDLSELALGWATYNGDQMSMYGVNAGVPKTLVRDLVRYVAQEDGGEVSKILYDVLDTPVSPELLPPDASGKIAQKTEDLVGPYELHDFFIFHVLRNGFGPEKIFFLAQKAFAGVYDDAVILKWLKNFYRRFFSQQFKRSCMPDGPKVGSVSLSPRGDWRMPSDAQARLWLGAAEAIEI
ncbi:MAG: NAD(+) synthase [Eubacterium sp.]|nr:NAD(+) synthase [Eubacterium sp.]